MVMPIPARLVPGRSLKTNDARAVPATTKARTNSSIEAVRVALRSEIDTLGTHCKSTTEADKSSTRLSEPKANIAGLCAVIAAYADTPNSITIHTNVTP